jgi:hypothetical protein
MKRSQAYKICFRKKRYSLRVAKRVAQHVNERGGRQVREYRCYLGRHWHIGGIKEEGDPTIPVDFCPPPDVGAGPNGLNIYQKTKL